MQVIIFPEVLQKKRKRKNGRFAFDAGVRERYRKQQDRVLQTPRNHPADIGLLAIEAMFPGESTFTTEPVNESPDKQRHSQTVDQSSVMRSQCDVRKNTGKQRTKQKTLADFAGEFSPN